MNDAQVIICFDGGCRPNPGRMYGSYSIQINGQIAIKRSRVPLGQGTNNEAEYLSLLEAILEADQVIQDAGLKLSECTLWILSDSMILVNRISRKRTSCKRNGPRGRRMGELTAECLELLGRFKHYSIRWESRNRNVERFGH